MFNLADISLVLWVPLVYFIFERFPVQKAIVFAFVSAWLFLPPSFIPLSGLPDWSKTMATVSSVMLCTALKRPEGYFRIRPSWFDLPVLAYCLCPFVSAVTANEGAYDGVSAILEETFRWGFPYLIGRAFLGDAAGNRMLCLGIAMGGISYVPVCLFEIRMGPVLKSLVFGINNNHTVWELRYGGYRPMGFLVTGLELGWWMCCAVLSAFMLWKGGTVKKLLGYSMGPIVGGLALIAVACKSTGALIQLALGIIVIHLARTTRTSLVLLPLLLIPPAYCITRTTGIWTGESLVTFTNDYFGVDRGQSLAFRLSQEEALIRSAMQRPVFGWARNGGFNPPDKYGHKLITDGLWIIVFGASGWVGLATLMVMLLLPTAIFAAKVKPKQWFHPEVAPVTALAMILPLFMIDNLSNAMLNPIYAIAMGSISGYLAGYSPRRLVSGMPKAETAGGLQAPTSPGQAVRGIVGGDAVADFEAGRYPEAIHHLDDQIDDLHRSFRRRPTADLLVELGRVHALRARCYARLHESSRSIEEREYLVGLSSQYAALLGGEPAANAEFAGNLNDLAWSLLATSPSDRAAVDRALAHATRVVQAHPGVGAYWNTLGVARYRAGDHLAAIQALSRSVNLSPTRGSPYDFYYLALANHRLGYAKPAGAWLGRGEEAYAAAHHDDAGLDRLRSEALAEVDA